MIFFKWEKIINKCVNDGFGELMIENQIKIKLVKKQSKSPAVCTNCDSKIEPDQVFYLEKGENEHIHSLIARKFCADCYSKYGERILLKGK